MFDEALCHIGCNKLNEGFWCGEGREWFRWIYKFHNAGIELFAVCELLTRTLIGYYVLIWHSGLMLSYDEHTVIEPVENSSSRFFQISCSQGILNSSRLSCYLLLRLLVYMYLSQLMRTFTNYLKCIVISS